MNSEPRKSSGPNRGERDPAHDTFSEEQIEQLTDMIADLLPSSKEAEQETGPLGPISEEDTGSYAPSVDDLKES